MPSWSPGTQVPPLSHVAEYTRMVLQELLSSGEANAKDEEENSTLYHARFCPRLLEAVGTRTRKKRP